MKKKVIITGASGMVGGHLLDICLASEEVGEVISLTRKPGKLRHEKLKEIVLEDFQNYEYLSEELTQVYAAFFCIGVYTGAVPRETFRAITVDYPVQLAKALYQHSPQAKFCLLSGQGADRTEKSRMMFAKDKGAAENQLAAMGLKAFHTFRPGYIYPVVPRKEPNFSYSLSRKLYPLIRLLGKNSSIKSTELAQGMFNVAMGDTQQEIFENRDILEQLT